MYRTCPSFPSCLSDSLARSLWNTSSTMTCFQIFSRRKQLFSRYWLALDSGDLAMPRSTTTRYWSGCKSLTGRCWTGSPHLCGRTSAACSTPSAEYHRDLIHSVHRWPASVGDSSWLRGRPLRESVCLCRSNRLQLNHAKTEVLWCTSSRRQHKIPSGPVRIGTTDVQPVSSIRIDADMSMRTHVTAIVRASFAALRQIRSMRQSLSRHALLTLVCALIVTKVDYCNSVIAWKIECIPTDGT